MNKTTFYSIILGVTLLAVAMFFALNSNNYSTDPLYFWGDFVAITGLTILSIEIILGNFHSYFENLLPELNMIQFHIILGTSGIILLLTHPILFAIRDSAPNYFLPSFATSTNYLISIGVFALYLLVITVLTSYLIRKFAYRTWKKIHWLNYLVLIFGYYHAFTTRLATRRGGFRIGSTTFNLTTEILQTFAFTVTGLLLLAGLRAYFKRMITTKVIITKVEYEAKNIVNLYYEPVKPVIWIPGQYGFIRVKFEDGFKETHPFTISSTPLQGFLRQTIKNSGLFTKKIQGITKGATAFFEGPYGTFTLKPEDKNIVMIAGGIGITPFKSMIQEATDSKKKTKILLLYTARTKPDLAFYAELNDCVKKNSNLQVVYTLDQETGTEWTGEKRRIDPEFLDKYVKNYANRTFYLCGPSGFMNAITKSLISKGVKEDCIKKEEFSF